MLDGYCITWISVPQCPSAPTAVMALVELLNNIAQRILWLAPSSSSHSNTDTLKFPAVLETPLFLLTHLLSGQVLLQGKLLLRKHQANLMLVWSRNEGLDFLSLREEKSSVSPAEISCRNKDVYVNISKLREVQVQRGRNVVKLPKRQRRTMKKCFTQSCPTNWRPSPQTGKW